MLKKLIALNGLAILGVALSHSAGWVQIALFIWSDPSIPSGEGVIGPSDSVIYFGLLILRQLIVFCIPAFLIVSGYFIAYALENRDKIQQWNVIRSRVVSMLIPYFFWSVIIFGSNYFINHVQYSFFDFVRIFFTTGADNTYYFVPLICYLYLLSYFLFPWAKKNWRSLLFFSAFLLILLLLMEYVQLFVINNEIVKVINQFIPNWTLPWWLFYYCLGIVFGLNVTKFKEYIENHRYQIAILTILAGIAAIIEPEIIYRTTGLEWRFIPRTISSITYAVLFTFSFIAWWPKTNQWVKPLSWFGGKSMGIYLLHMKAMEFLARMAYHFFPAVFSFQFGYLALLLLVGLGGPLSLILAIEKSPARKYYRFLFG